MIQFKFQRKRLLQRRGFVLSCLILPVAAGVAVYGALSGFSGKDLSVSQQNGIQAVRTVASESVLSSVSPRADTFKTDLAPKPQVQAQEKATLTEQLSSIQASITNMLEASNELLVSEKKVMVGKGDTLMDLLVKKAAVPRDDAYRAVQALSKIYNPREIYPGREITVFFHKDPSVTDPKFSGVRIEKDIVNAVSVNRNDEGTFTVSKEEKGVHRVLKGFRGSISNSLYVDAKAAGVPDSVILELIKMYSWNVDFQREVHSGDAFEVMYEEYRTEEGRLVPGRGNIVYAELALSDNEMPFYRFEEKNGDIGYYDDTGRSAKKPLMKTPVDGARLSSGFGMRRHPVLGYSKMHKGVDFAAPRGTPIYAAGDGTIKKIGPFSTYGNYVRIRHRAGLETAYAHMKGFKSGLRVGSRVKQGDIIGYVGTTGRSTGPHLHYEVIANNAQVNPSSVKMPTGKALAGKDLKAFKTQMAQTQQTFKGLSRAVTVAAAKDVSRKL